MATNVSLVYQTPTTTKGHHLPQSQLSVSRYFSFKELLYRCRHRWKSFFRWVWQQNQTLTAHQTASGLVLTLSSSSCTCGQRGDAQSINPPPSPRREGHVAHASVSHRRDIPPERISTGNFFKAIAAVILALQHSEHRIEPKLAIRCYSEGVTLRPRLCHLSFVTSSLRWIEIHAKGLSWRTL